MSKWLNPKIYPIPYDKTVIAYLQHPNNTEVCCIQKSSYSNSYYPMIIGNNEDYFDTEDAEIKENEIIAWRTLPNAPNK